MNTFCAKFLIGKENLSVKSNFIHKQKFLAKLETLQAGFNMLSRTVVHPKGEKAFYQSLTLKTFVTRHLYINTGYRLGDFKDPQNLMLGIGIRL